MFPDTLPTELKTHMNTCNDIRWLSLIDVDILDSNKNIGLAHNCSSLHIENIFMFTSIIVSTRLTSPILISHWGNQHVLLILAFRTDRNHQSSLSVYPLCHINRFTSRLNISHCHAIALFTSMVSRAFILVNTSSSILHIRRDWSNIGDSNSYFLLLQTCCPLNTNTAYEGNHSDEIRTHVDGCFGYIYPS